MGYFDDFFHKLGIKEPEEDLSTSGSDQDQDDDIKVDVPDLLEKVFALEDTVKEMKAEKKDLESEIKKLQMFNLKLAQQTTPPPDTDKSLSDMFSSQDWHPLNKRKGN